MSSSAPFASDLEYLDAVIQAADTAIISAIDYLNANEDKGTKEYDGKEAAKCYHNLEERLIELRKVIGPWLITIATKVHHPDPPSWGRPFVEETNSSNVWQSNGVNILIGTLQRRYHELLTWRVLFAGPQPPAQGKAKQDYGEGTESEVKVELVSNLPELKPHDRQMWQLSLIDGMTQSKIAEKINDQHGTNYKQARVSEGIKRAKAHADASGLTEKTVKFTEKGMPPISTDPAKLDLGKRRDRRAFHAVEKAKQMAKEQ